MTHLDRLEQYRERYTAINKGWLSATQRYQTRVASLLDGCPRVLDLGCGRGGIVERLHTNGRWFGVDPDLVSLRSHRLPCLPRSQTQAQHLPFAEASFNLVVSSWVLEHLVEPRLVFDEVARVLQPGGHWLFLTPNALHPIPRASYLLAGLCKLQRVLVRTSYARQDADTFRVHYCANTMMQISRLASQANLRLCRIDLIDDPAYFAFNEMSFRLAVLLEKLIPASAKVHLLGHFIKPEA